MEFDFVAIGDTVTDAFIKLKDASVHCDVNKENCELTMKFADKIPYEDAFIVPAVGNSANAAVSASRLGLKSALYTNLGGDYYGKECLESLEKDNVSTHLIKINEDKKTNYHYVLWYEDDRTILIKHEAYEYSLPDLGNPKWIYLSSLGENVGNLYGELSAYLNSHPDVKLAFQPGTYQIKLGYEGLPDIYKRSEVFFCNKEEAQRILNTEEEGVKNLLQSIKNLGPKIVVITDGKDGSYFMDDSGAWFMPIYPDPKPPYERTGAGDAFSSTFTAALALGLSPGDAIRWAPINSMSVVQAVGAQEGLLNKEKIGEYLKAAPVGYTLKPLP